MAMDNQSPHLRVCVPDEIKQLKAWFLFQYEDNNNGKKPDKIPIYATGLSRKGRQGDKHDREQLLTFDELMTVSKKKKVRADGVNLACFAEHNLSVFDYDNCFESFDSIAAIHADTYVEISPSGNGLHAVYFGQLTDQHKKDKPEIFCASRSISFTGNAISHKPIAEIPPKISQYYETLFGKTSQKTDFDELESFVKEGMSRQEIQDLLKIIPPDCPYQEWIEVGMAIHHESEGEWFDLYHDWSAEAHNYCGDLTLQDKFNGFDTPRDRQPITGKRIKDIAKGYLAQQQKRERQQGIIDPSTFPKREDVPFHGISGFDFARSPLPLWLMESLIQERSLNFLFGESGAGKSFIVLDMMLKLAQGLPWCGHETKKSKVLYVVAEGEAGMRKRALAQEMHRDINWKDIDITFLPARPNLLDYETIKNVIAFAHYEGPFDIIVFDTFAKCISGGNENDGKDMTLALDHLSMIRDNSATSIMLVHHSGKDKARGMRGHSCLKAGVDTQFMVDRDEDYREFVVDKEKDEKDGQRYGFELEIVKVGVNQFGKDETSCVVNFTATKPSLPNGKKLGKLENIVYQFLTDHVLAEEGLARQYVIQSVAELLPEDEGAKRDMRKVQASKGLKRYLSCDVAMHFEQDGFIRNLI